MKLTLHVTETNGNEYDVTTNLGVVVAWERKFKLPASKMASGEMAAEWLAFLAWESCKRANIAVPASFTEYADSRVDNIDIVDAEAANPTRGAVSDDN